jgi:endonuclease YncB( thermonuclease family)
MRHDPGTDTYQSMLPDRAPEVFRFRGGTHVIDGDTIEVETVRIVDARGRAWGGTKERLRLVGIDAPDRGTRGHAEAGSTLARLLGAQAQCACVAAPAPPGDPCARDRWNRVLVVCAAGNRSANAEMVRLGFARARYLCDYAAEEREARAAGRGLWPGLASIPSDCN